MRNRINWIQRKTNIWVRGQVGVKQEGLLCFNKKTKLVKYGHWKRRKDRLVLNSIKGELPGKKQRKMGWIDDIEHWIDGGHEMVRGTARRCQWSN